MLSAAFILTQCWHRVPGGTATSALGLAEALHRRDDVRIIGVGAAGRTPRPPYSPPLRTKQLRLPYPLLYDAWQDRGWFPPESATGPVDLVHATTTVVPPTRSARLVVTVHDLFPYLEPAVLTARGARVLQRGIDLAKERADIVCCPSQQTADDCVAHGFDPARLRVVPWGTKAEQPSGAAVERTRAIYGLHRPYLLWVGTVEPRKNLKMLLDAFAAAALDGVDLVLVGPDGWNEDLTDRLAQLGPRARRLGFLPEDHLGAIYAGARALLFPSKREGFGLPALEAMARGTAVVGAAGTAIAEVVGDTGQLVDPNDRSGWQAAIADAAEPAWGHDQRAAVAQRAATFTWARAAEQTVAAYRAAVA